MAKSVFASFFLLLSMISVYNLGLADANYQSITWCIAKPSADVSSLQANINFACDPNQGKVDCSIVQPGGNCYDPDNVNNHASVVMNLYHQNNHRKDGTCDFFVENTVTRTGLFVYDKLITQALASASTTLHKNRWAQRAL